MKKALFTALILGVTTLFASAFAQTTASVSVGFKNGANAGVSHKVHVKIPGVVVLRVQSTDGNPGVVNFDFTTAAGLSTYQSALDGTTSSIIDYTSALGNGQTNLTSVDVFTNTNNAPTVSVGWSLDSTASNTSNLGASDVYFNGNNANSGVDASPTSASGWQTVATPSMFSIKADPATTPGDATFVVTYTATAN